MTFSISDFSGVISSKGLASPNKFEVFIKFPNGLRQKELELMCESASIAGRSVQSALDIQYGIRREIAYGAPTYTALSLVFLCTGNFDEKRILDKWNNSIVNAERGFDVEYYNNYIGEIEVVLLDRSGEPTGHSVRYLEAYPKSVQQIDLNHATQDATLRVTAEFSYSRFITNETSQAVPKPVTSRVDPHN